MRSLISVERLTKNFGGLIAVDRIDLQLTRDKVTGIIGPNGSGKTTLFNLLSGYFSPTSGRIRFNENDITKVAPHKRVEMGIVRTFQLVSVFDHISVWENLVLSTIKFKPRQQTLGKFFFSNTRNQEIQEDCMEKVRLVGLESKINEPTSALSYGDKRMLEIAIALSLRPKVLLLDEPFSGLSEHEIGSVLELISCLQQDITLVIIEHKISKIVDLIQRLCVMNAGRIVCEGNPQEVLANDKVRECYWGKEQ
jgi:branched-chain amino acid transport system ATP-binding protein